MQHHEKIKNSTLIGTIINVDEFVEVIRWAHSPNETFALGTKKGRGEFGLESSIQFLLI